MVTEEPSSDIPSAQADLLETAAGALATAIARLWPDARLVQRGRAELPFRGFFQDVDLDRPLTPGDLLDAARAMGEDLPGEASCAFHLLSEVREVFPGDGSGDATARPLQRILGIAASSIGELKKDQAVLERAAERDHRWIGRNLRLFRELPSVPGDFLWLPRGTTFFHTLLERTRGFLSRNGFLEVRSPHRPEGPDHAAIVATEPPHSAQLPLRFFEFHRSERCGPISPGEALRHARSFTRDLESVFCRPDQVSSEMERCIEIVRRPYDALGIALRARLTTPPSQSGRLDLPRLLGDGQVDSIEAGEDPSLPGPRLDFVAPNIFGNFEFSAASIRADPRCGEDDTVKNDRPASVAPITWARISCTLFSSLESFLAAAIESTFGYLPLWLAPVQVRVINVSNATREYARKVLARLTEAGLRAELDERSTRFQKKRRDALLMKIPVPLAVGAREAEDGSVTLLPRDSSGEKRSIPVEGLLEELRQRLAAASRF